MAPYTALRSASTPKKSTPILKRKKSTDTAELNLTEKGIGSVGEVSDDEDDLEVFGADMEVEGRREEEEVLEDSLEDTQMLLSKENDEDEGVGTAIEGEKRTGVKRFIPSRRTSLLLLLLILSTSLLSLFFHPSSPISSTLDSIASYYHSSNILNLKPGTYSSESKLGLNPLDPESKFGDIPFAQLGGSEKAEGGEIPGWAGGDDGSKEYEKSRLLEEGEGKGRRWNGTHWWDKTVILVSLDGVRADYLEKGLTKHLVGISRKGIKAEFLQPVFPSLTFPNHWALVTGLYPASHGIVANDFYDPDLNDEFVYTEPSKSWNSKWWLGEPIWATAIKNKLRAVVLMWPGPPIMLDGTKPTQWYPFQNKYHYSKKVHKLAEWLDMPLSTRPHLMNIYAPEVDQEGHRTGPHSHGVESELIEMDNFALDVMNELEKRNLTDVVDVIFLSDHGMTETHDERLVFLDDILGEEGWKGIARNEGWPSAGLRFHPHINETEMLEKLLVASKASNGGFNVHTNETMPDRWHFTGHARIAPIYVVPHTGWAISDRHDYHVVMGGDYRPKGNHGYDNAAPSMHAVFVAHGPFASSIKAQRRKKREEDSKGVIVAVVGEKEEEVISTIPGFANLEVYNLVAKLLGIPLEGRAPNNGTVGFWEQYLL